LRVGSDEENCLGQPFRFLRARAFHRSICIDFEAFRKRVLGDKRYISICHNKAMIILIYASKLPAPQLPKVEVQPVRAIDASVAVANP
jgi:hypothetical protein